MTKTHFEQKQVFTASKEIDWDSGPWKGMSPKKEYSKFEIIFLIDGNFELNAYHKHSENNIDYGERNYIQQSFFSGKYEIKEDNTESLFATLNIIFEKKIIKECTNFDFIPEAEITHNITVTFTKKINEFNFSDSEIFVYERGYYGSFVFTH